MKKLLVLNGGAAVKDGNKSAYLRFDNPREAFAKSGINTGDVLVYDAILKVLSYDSISNIQFSHATNQKLWPQEPVDATVIRGSNYITESVDLTDAVPLLKSLKSPIVAMGIGAQAANYRKLTLKPGTVTAWRIIGDKCETIGVRGHYSAEVLNDLGIKNVRVIGCPSFYRALKPTLKIQWPPRSLDNLRIGLTLNKYLANEYASNAAKTNRLQRALIREVAHNCNGRLYSQGEKEETLIIHSEGDEKLAHVSSVLNRFDLGDDLPTKRLLMERMLAFFDVDEWAQDVKANVDLMLGFRLHGNVIALHQGIPAVFFKYDTRMRELISFFSLPSIEVDDFLPVSVERIVESLDFTSTEKAYVRAYEQYHTFLTENGLSHVLPAPSSKRVAKDIPENNLNLAFTADELRRWFVEEVDYFTNGLETLRGRAWRLETALRQSRLREAKSA